MSGAFGGSLYANGQSLPSWKKNFNYDISKWDTSNVTNMKEMFKNATAFNQDISTKEVTVGGSTYMAWDVSKVDSSRVFSIRI